ncbi:MAG: hypothetical protein IIC22_07925, partial [Chloroflexi bacterium]|nr:hypothetical protein [Chloroflexota bacterium]
MGSADETHAREENDREQRIFMRMLNMLPGWMKTATLRAAMLIAIGLVAVAGGLTSQKAFTTTEAAFEPQAEQEGFQPQEGDGPVPVGINDFTISTPVQGFGDRQNSNIWSMKWWDSKGKLFVGTNRAWLCWSHGAIVKSFPVLGFIYPPKDPDVECAKDINDLELQAEIWSWTPDAIDPAAAGTWEMVYRSPADVPIPDTDPVKFTARDIGYRAMEVFTEPDGTEALYVGGTNAKGIYGDVPPPRILRSTDGVNFEPIPQEPGTFMGELPKSGFRSMVSYNGKLYAIHSITQGNGAVIASADPASGNDAWSTVTPGTVDNPVMKAYQLKAFNDFLYIGTIDTQNGYSIFKTDGEGDPLTFTTIIEKGGYLPSPSIFPLSAAVFKGSLYMGTDNPAEIVRINPDDSWDLIVGTPRQLPDGSWKYPLSGMNEGFNNSLNEHIWRMDGDDSALYVGTYDYSTWNRTCPEKEILLRENMGFDLYKSTDGVHFSAITMNGFGDKFEFGVRALKTTPYGLFVGSANFYYGTNVHRGYPTTRGSFWLDPPGRLWSWPISSPTTGVLLGWEASTGATTYRVFRSEYIEIPLHLFDGYIGKNGCFKDYEPPIEELPEGLAGYLSQMPKPLIGIGLKPLPFKKGEVPGESVELGVTDDTFFFDATAEKGVKYAYHVIAEDETGVLFPSETTNISTVP